jgi:polar amino acid transport system ATP-binding protein
MEKGEVLALVGPSGSGKSTVLRALVGLTPVTGGSVEIHGARHRLPQRGLRPRRARPDGDRVPAVQPVPEHERAAQRHARPREDQAPPAPEVRAEAEKLLAMVGLADKVEAYPDQLSGGQQQRVAIARALALHPEILLLDEVTSALDPELVNEVLDTIRRLASQGMTMILVSHEMAFVREVADRVVFMDRGEVIEVGPPKELFDTPKSDRARDFFGKILRH